MPVTPELREEMIRRGIWGRFLKNKAANKPESNLSKDAKQLGGMVLGIAEMANPATATRSMARNAVNDARTPEDAATGPSGAQVGAEMALGQTMLPVFAKTFLGRSQIPDFAAGATEAVSQAQAHPLIAPLEAALLAFGVGQPARAASKLGAQRVAQTAIVDAAIQKSVSKRTADRIAGYRVIASEKVRAGRLRRAALQEKVSEGFRPNPDQLTLPAPETIYGEGFVSKPGKLIRRKAVKGQEKVGPGGTKARPARLTKKGLGPKKTAQQFRRENPPALSNVAHGSEAVPFNADGTIAKTAEPISAQILVPESGPAVFKGGVVGKILKRVKNQASAVGSRRIVNGMSNVFQEHHTQAGVKIEQLRTLGLHKAPLEVRKNLLLELGGKRTGDAAAAKLAKNIGPLLDDLAGQVEKLGIMVEDSFGNVRPWHRRADYAPRMGKPEIVRMMFDDSAKAFEKARARATGNFTDDDLWDAISSLHEKKQLKISKGTEKQIQHLIDKNYAKSTGEALAILGRRTTHQKHRMFGNIDKERSDFWLPGFYEEDGARALTEYVYGATRRIAEAKNFGPKGEHMLSMLKSIGDEGERKYFNDVADIFFGNTDRQFARDNPGLKRFYDHYTNYSVASKIGLGFAVIPNMTQFAISTLPVLGVMRTAKTALRVAFSAQYRSELRGRGIILSESMRKLMAQEFGGTEGWLTSKTMRAFEGVNKVQKYVAAGAMEDAWDDLARAAVTPGDPKHAKAVRMMQRLGVNPADATTTAAKNRGIFSFAANSQLQKNILEEAVALNIPSFRPLMLFKRFGLRQATFMYDWVLKDALRDPLPLLRLGAGGYAGGEFVGWAKKELKAALSGRREYEDPSMGTFLSPTFKRFARNFADVGSLGVATDLFRVTSDMPEDIVMDIYNSAAFAISPLPFSDIGTVGGLVKNTAREIGRRGLAAGSRRAAIKATGALGGSLIRHSTERLKSQAQVYDESVSRKRRMQTEINDLYRADRFPEAIKKFVAWNKSFPMFPVNLPTPQEWVKMKERDALLKADISKEFTQ